VRWQKPDGELVPPSEFIDVTEDTGLIVFLGLWVMREACSTARRLQQEFPRQEPLTISINISPRQFSQPDLAAQVRQIITETGIDPRTVRLEITESITAGDVERVVHVLSLWMLTSSRVVTGPVRMKSAQKDGISCASACNCSGNDLHRQANYPSQHCNYCPKDVWIFTKHDHTDRYKSRQCSEKCAYGAEKFRSINLSTGAAF
jgi:hypothetical protein